MEQYQKFILTWGSESETLTANPDGWAENGQSFERSKVYHGVFQSYTVETFRFSKVTGGGGEFIKTAYDADDIKAVVTVEVYEKNPQTDDFDLIYEGRLNFDPKRINDRRDYFEIGFVQSGNVQDFMTRDELELDINSLESISGDTVTDFSGMPIPITFNPVDLYRKCVTDGNFEYWFYWAVADLTGYESYERIPVISTAVEMNYYAPTIIINEMGSAFTATTGPAQVERSQTIYESPFTDYEAKIRFNAVTAPNDDPTNYFNIRFDDRRIPGTDTWARVSIEFGVEVYDKDDVLVSSEVVDTQTFERDSRLGDTVNAIFRVELDFANMRDNDYTVPAEGKLCLKMFAIIDTSYYNYGTVVSCSKPYDFEIDFSEITDGAIASDVDCFLPHEAFERALQLITGENNKLYSSFFGRTDSELRTYASNGSGAFAALTSGWNLRGFPDKQFIVTFRDLFKTYNAIYNLGCSYDIINQRFTIDEKREYYDYDYIMFDLGEIAELSIKPFDQAYFNEIEGGFDIDGNYDELQGVNEFQSKYVWSEDQPVKETAQLRAPYSADTVAMELSRRLPYENYASTDSDHDTKIFVVDTDGSEATQGGSILSGFDGIDQYYNVAFSARENLLRHANFIKAAYWKETDFTIRFRKSEKGTDITYENQNGEIVDEFKNISSDEMSSIIRLFNPQYYEFDGIFDSDKLETLQTNPHGLIKFTFDYENYAGFVDVIQTQDYQKQANYKLIAWDATDEVIKEFMDESDATFMDDDDHTFL